MLEVGWCWPNGCFVLWYSLVGICSSLEDDNLASKKSRLVVWIKVLCRWTCCHWLPIQRWIHIDIVTQFLLKKPAARRYLQASVQKRAAGTEVDFLCGHTPYHANTSSAYPKLSLPLWPSFWHIPNVFPSHVPQRRAAQGGTVLYQLHSTPAPICFLFLTSTCWKVCRWVSPSTTNTQELLRCCKTTI